MSKEWLIKEIFWIIDNPEIFDKQQIKERITSLVTEADETLWATDSKTDELEEEIQTLQNRLEEYTYESDNMSIEIANLEEQLLDKENEIVELKEKLEKN